MENVTENQALTEVNDDLELETVDELLVEEISIDGMCGVY